MKDKEASCINVYDAKFYAEMHLPNPIGVCSYQEFDRLAKLQAENAKLRECVEFYSVNGLSNATVGTKIDTKLTHQFYINGEYARQVLKKLDEK